MGSKPLPLAPAAPPARSPRLGLLLAGIILVALNLRPALAGVGPLVGDIRAATGLSNTALGLLTTLPLLAFGVVSTLTPRVTGRFGIEATLAAALAFIGVGTLTRSVPSVALLFGGTVVLGVGIALGNVLLPALVKRDFPERSGAMTSLYSSAMGLGATVAAGASVPLASAFGWRGSLGVWAGLAGVALLAWLPILRGRALPRQSGGGQTGLRGLGRSPRAWQIALFMGLQSLTFYVVLAWLPDLLQSRGMGEAEAGWMLALSQAAGLLGSGTVPLWGGRLSDHRRIVWILLLVEAVALAGLFAPTSTFAAVWVFLLGMVLGGTFALSLLFLVVRAPDAETATALSGMAQAVGYLIAATGPALFGFLHDLSAGWTVPLGFLVAVLVAKGVVGLGAGRPGFVRRPAAAPLL